MKKRCWIDGISDLEFDKVGRWTLFSMIALGAILLLGGVAPDKLEYPSGRNVLTVAEKQSQLYLNDFPEQDKAIWARAIESNPLLLLKLNENPL